MALNTAMAAVIAKGVKSSLYRLELIRGFLELF
jgi:hypothetical protein